MVVLLCERSLMVLHGIHSINEMNEIKVKATARLWGLLFSPKPKTALRNSHLKHMTKISSKREHPLSVHGVIWAFWSHFHFHANWHNCYDIRLKHLREPPILRATWALKVWPYINNCHHSTDSLEFTPVLHKTPQIHRKLFVQCAN